MSTGSNQSWRCLWASRCLGGASVLNWQRCMQKSLRIKSICIEHLRNDGEMRRRRETHRGVCTKVRTIIAKVQLHIIGRKEDGEPINATQNAEKLANAECH